MLSGKACSRALRSHFLMDSALNAIIISKAYGIESFVSEEQSEVMEIENFQDPTDGSNYIEVDDIHHHLNDIHHLIHGHNYRG